MRALFHGANTLLIMRHAHPPLCRMMQIKPADHTKEQTPHWALK